MPTFTVKTADLAAAIKRCSGVIERRNTIPVLTMVRAYFGPGAFGLVTTDLDIEVHANGAANGDEHSEFLINFEALKNTVDALGKSETLRIAVACDHNVVKPQAHISGDGKTRVYSLPILAGDYDEMQEVSNGKGGLEMKPTGRRLVHFDDFPLLKRNPEAADVLTIDGPADVIAKHLASVAGAMSEEETRYYLNGVYIFGAGESKYPPAGMVATDGYRLYLCDLIGCQTVGAGGAILPAKCVGLLQKILKNQYGKVSATFTGERGEFIGDGWRVVTKLIDGTFPDFRRVIPHERADAFKITLDAAPLVDFAKAAKKMTADRTNSVKMVANEHFECSVNNPENGTLREIIYAEIEKPAGGDADSAVEFSVNCIYIAEAISDLRSVTLQVLDSAAPILITSPQLCGLRVIMPLRVK